MKSYKNWFEHSPHLSWVSGNDLLCHSFNLAWLQYTGAPLQKCVGEGWTESIHPDDLTRWKSCLNAHKKNRNPFEVELRIRNNKSKYNWFAFKCNPIIDAQGVFDGYYATAIDITRRVSNEIEIKLLQEELEESEKLLSDSQSAGRIGSFSLDFTTNQVTFTKEGLRLFDYVFESTVTTYSELLKSIYIGDREMAISAMRDCLKNKLNALELEFRVLLKDESIRWILLRGNFVYNDKNEAVQFVAVCMDNTERIEGQLQLENEKAKAIQAGKMAILGEMSSGIAHEINNPLSIIHGSAYNLLLLAKKGEVSRPLITETAEKILSTTTRITKIIKGLRAFSRDGSKESFEPMNIGKIIADTLDLCSARFQNNSIDLRVAPFDNDLEIECRPVQISQILLNLLGNSYDAIENFPAPWIEFNIEDKGEYIEISITDCGKGIVKEVADKIMQPFFTTKEVGRGTGLGLSISAGIVKDHNGKLFLDRSSPNTKFVLQLPKQQPQESATAA